MIRTCGKSSGGISKKTQFHFFHLIIVGNKTKRANLKTGVSRKQSTSNFPKSEHFLPPDRHTYVLFVFLPKCSFFRKFDVLNFLETPVLRFAFLAL